MWKPLSNQIVALTPLRIEPVFTPRIWGTRSLAPIYPDKTNLSDPIGEAWLTGRDCKIASSPFAGKTLGAAWYEMSAEWRGTALADATEFPLLLKFIFPNERLSIQVHPDDAYASVHEEKAGGRGKTEMWHVVSAEADAQVLVGLKPDVNRGKFLEALQSHTLENLFEAHPVHAGDTFFVPAGTQHTIGSGMIICEVQQYSDLTYRVYDFGRLDPQGKPRELHIEKALEVTKFGEPYEGKMDGLPLPSREASRILLAACSYFATERCEFEKILEIQCDAKHFDLFVFLAGEGSLEWEHGKANYNRGQCWFLPSALGNLSLNASKPTTLLRAYVPDLNALRNSLRAQGIPEHRFQQVFFG